MEERFSLQPFVRKYGPERIIFVEKRRPLKGWLFAYTSTMDSEVWTTSRLVDDRYPVDGDYKVTLSALSDGAENSSEYGAQHYYVTDLESLVNQKSIRVYVITEEGELIEWNKLSKE